MKVQSTSYAVDNGIRDMQSRRAALERTQAQVTSGRRVVDPSDDPVAAADAERARASLARVDVERRAITFAKNTLGTADGALSDATGVLQNARETLVAAGNGAYNDTDRATLAEQLTQARAQLLAAANSGDGAGGYVFGGLGSRTAPFRDNGAAPATVTYSPMAGEQQVGTELALSTSLDGRSAFTEQPLAGGGTQNVFGVLDAAIGLLRTPGASPATITAGMQAAMDGVDAGLDALQLKRTQVGEQLRAVDAREQTLSGRQIQAESYRSDLIDVDWVQALSQLSSQQTALDAAMKTYTQVSQMSLFKYL